MPGKKPSSPQVPNTATKDHKQNTTTLLETLASYGIFRFFVLWLVSWLLLMSFLLSEFLKQKNYVEVFPEWLVLPSLIHAGTALIIAAILYFSKYPRLFAAKFAAAVLLALFFVNYSDRLTPVLGFIKTFAPILPDPSSGSYAAIISLIFIAILSYLAIWIGILINRLLIKRPNIKDSSKNLILAILIIVGFMFGSQLLRTIPILSAIISQRNISVAPFSEPKHEASPEKPDVYYLVFDRYNSDETLTESFKYDNSDFTRNLRAQGFTVNTDAYSNYPYTPMSISSTMIADYTNDLTDQYRNDPVQARTLYHNLIHQSPVVKGFKDAGYTYHNIGSVYGATSKAPLADVDHMYEIQLQAFGKNKRLRGVEQTTFKQSIFYHFTQLNDISWWPIKNEQMPQPEYTTKQFSTLNSLAREDAGGRFIFAHILLPHPPYFFNADGSYSSYTEEDNMGKSVEQKYIDQVEFVNTRIEKLVATIKATSNDQAVIILNADEGASPIHVLTDVYNESEPVEFEKDDLSSWPDEWLRMKYGIQQAVHIPKATVNDMAHLSSVNVFRIVMNRYLGYDLDYLPQCHLGLKNNSKPFDQTDFTKRFLGKTSDFCQELVN